MSAGATYYHSNDKSVDVRARQLPKLYRDKLHKIDRQYLSTPEEVGPLERHLQDFGNLKCLVVGQFGEVSQDTHSLLANFTSEKSKKFQQMYGRTLFDFETSQILQHYCCRLSICSVRAQASCLLARLGHFGHHASQAAKRRDKARGVEEASQQEMRSHWEASVRSRRISRVGFLHI